jgi:hypothetical protein
MVDRTGGRVHVSEGQGGGRRDTRWWCDVDRSKEVLVFDGAGGARVEGVLRERVFGEKQRCDGAARTGRAAAGLKKERACREGGVGGARADVTWGGGRCKPNERCALPFGSGGESADYRECKCDF